MANYRTSRHARPVQDRRNPLALCPRCTIYPVLDPASHSTKESLCVRNDRSYLSSPLQLAPLSPSHSSCVRVAPGTCRRRPGSRAGRRCGYRRTSAHTERIEVRTWSREGEPQSAYRLPTCSTCPPHRPLTPLRPPSGGVHLAIKAEKSNYARRVAKFL